VAVPGAPTLLIAIPHNVCAPRADSHTRRRWCANQKSSGASPGTGRNTTPAAAPGASTAGATVVATPTPRRRPLRSARRVSLLWRKPAAVCRPDTRNPEGDRACFLLHLLAGRIRALLPRRRHRRRGDYRRDIGAIRLQAGRVRRLNVSTAIKPERRNGRRSTRSQREKACGRALLHSRRRDDSARPLRARTHARPHCCAKGCDAAGPEMLADRSRPLGRMSGDLVDCSGRRRYRGLDRQRWAVAPVGPGPVVDPHALIAGHA
jgi:hypothetical protein